jgi:hypothetical protein
VSALQEKKVEKIEINLEIQPTRILGSLRTRAGNEFNIYATSSREHVLMFPHQGNKRARERP